MVAGKHWLAHRYAYALTHGEIPADLLVMHECDNRVCVNPSHLRLGTYMDNAQDMVQKNRGKGCTSACGEANYRAKLTQAQVDAIRAEVEEVLEAEILCGVPKRGYVSRIAQRYGVNPKTISKIINGRTWKGTTVPIAA